MFVERVDEIVMIMNDKQTNVEIRVQFRWRNFISYCAYFRNTNKSAHPCKPGTILMMNGTINGLLRTAAPSNADQSRLPIHASLCISKNGYPRPRADHDGTSSRRFADHHREHVSRSCPGLPGPVLQYCAGAGRRSISWHQHQESHVPMLRAPCRHRRRHLGA